MSDAPQRIWATTNGRRTRFHLGGETGGHLGSLIGGWCEHKDKDWAHEYIRADLAPTDAQVMAHPKVQKLVEAVNFLSDRLHAFSLTDNADEMCTEFIGHVEPAHARLCAALRDLETP